jgi:hypothetical protein
MYFVFALCEGKNEIHQKDKVPLRISALGEHITLQDSILRAKSEEEESYRGTL